MHYCYLIYADNLTYIGTTNNLEKRLMQHNNILSGGAKATKKSNNWNYHTTVKFNTKSEALSFEWMWKHYKNKNNKWVGTRSGITNKIKRLNEIKDRYEIIEIK